MASRPIAAGGLVDQRIVVHDAARGELTARWPRSSGLASSTLKTSSRLGHGITQDLDLDGPRRGVARGPT